MQQAWECKIWPQEEEEATPLKKQSKEGIPSKAPVLGQQVIEKDGEDRRKLGGVERKK